MVMILSCFLVVGLFSFVSFIPKKLLFFFLKMQREFCFFFISAWSACSFFKKLVHSHEHHRPYTEQQPIFILQWFATPHRVLRAQGVCARVRVNGCMYVCSRTRVQCGSDNSHFKTRALVWNLAQFVKNVKEKKKKTFKAHRLVSTFPTFALYWLFSMTYFFSCGHFNNYYVFFFVYYR